MTDKTQCAQPAHTPGPWRIWTSNSFRRISSDATGKDGDVLHAVVHRSDGHPDLHFPNGGFDGPDACLIAAAPELLEALRITIGNVRSLGPAGALAPVHTPYREWLAQLEAAYTKATGAKA